MDPGIFSDCSPEHLLWQFEVNNIVDLTPPKVVSSGMFPPPDDQADLITKTDPIQATGQITVNSPPAFYQAASFTSANKVPITAPWSDAGGTVSSNCQEINLLQVSVPSGATQALLFRDAINLGSGVINGNTANFSYCSLALTLVSGNYDDPGNCENQDCLWEINLSPMIVADTLTIGSRIYEFVSTAPNTNQIEVSGINGTALNIATALNSHSAVEPVAYGGGAIVNIQARVAGAAGNNIALITDSAGLTLTPASGHLEGGIDGGRQITPQDQPDKPRNAIIQVNFTESVNPLTISGAAGDVVNYIAARCVSGLCAGAGLFNCGANMCVDGNFVLSNRYRTVEFIPDNECGANSCGEPVYCLPEDSEIQLDIAAAGLDTCTSNNDCITRTPYTVCSPADSVCEDGNGVNYPLAEIPIDGIVDMALNSLDGNRDGEAIGPPGIYDENLESGSGDNYQWSFFIGAEIFISAPVINLATPVHTGSGVSLTDPILIDFSTLMMSSTLRSGGKRVVSGPFSATHKFINLWNFSGLPTGYWILKKDNDSSTPPDGFPDWTRAILMHSMLGDNTSYRVQVGSGAKDIYQNCYRPSSGPGCVSGGPSCCPEGGFGQPIAPTAVLDESGNCP